MAQPSIALPDFIGRVTHFQGDAAVLVSGGSDSVALLLLVARFGVGQWRRLRVLHFDHQLRPDSAHDAAFVARLAEQVGLPFDLIRLDPDAIRAHGDGIQAAARDMRRVATLRYLAEHRLSWCLLGHTHDDQLETVVSQTLRGRGPQDRRGMGRTAGPAQRPLLDVTREQLQQWLRSMGQPWCSDSTNASDAYERSYIRMHVVPELRLRGDDRRILFSASSAEGLWRAAHARIMRQCGASPATALAVKVSPRLPSDELSALALWVAHRGMQVSAAQWSVLLRSGRIQMDVHGGRLARLGPWVWAVRPVDLATLVGAVTRWHGLDKASSVSILSAGVGYPPQSRFSLGGRTLRAKEVYRSCCIPGFLRPMVGWKIENRELRVFPAAKNGLAAVHLLP